MTLAAIFPRSVGVGVGRLLGRWRFDRGLINTLPAPGDAGQLLILGQPCAPERLKETGLLPLKKTLVDRAGTAKALARQGFPLAARAYTMASNTSGADLAGRPAPGLHAWCLNGERTGWEMSGSARCQN